MPMSMHDLIRQLREPNTTKIVLLVADGLGGLPIEPGGKTELETARHAEPRRLAAEGTVGLSTPVAPGITPGLGARAPRPVRLRPARAPHRPRRARGARHRRRGRARGRRDPGQLLHDRRRGARHRPPRRSHPDRDLRASSSPSSASGVKIEGVETLIEPVREYRLVVRFRGDGLGDNVCDTDPLSTGLHTLEPKAGDPASEKTAKVAAEFLRQARADPQGRAPGQLPDDARVRQVPARSPRWKTSTASSRSRSPSTRCTAAWRGSSA